MKGWHKESYRHYLAAKGIKTNRYMARGVASSRKFQSLPSKDIGRQAIGFLGPIDTKTSRLPQSDFKTPENVMQSEEERKEFLSEIKRKKEELKQDKKSVKEEKAKSVEELKEFRKTGKIPEEEFTPGKIQVVALTIGGRRQRFPVVTIPDIEEKVIEKRTGVSSVTTPSASLLEQKSLRRKPRASKIKTEAPEQKEDLSKDMIFTEYVDRPSLKKLNEFGFKVSIDENVKKTIKKNIKKKENGKK